MIARLQKPHNKKKGPKPTIKRRMADPGLLTPLSAVRFIPSARRALNWIKKGKFDSLSREELQDIVDKGLKKNKVAEKKDPVDRSFRRGIRPLRSKPASRKLLRVLEHPSSRVRSSEEGSKLRGDKPNSFKLSVIYEENS